MTLSIRNPDEARVILVAGAIGAGKTTVANYLVEAADFEEVSFAGPLKRICQEAFLLEDHHVFGTQAQKAAPLDRGEFYPDVDADGNPLTPRRILEHVGTEGFRALCPDIWVLHALNTAEAWASSCQHVVVPDARFANEMATFVNELGAEVWEVRRLGYEEPSTGHASDNYREAIRQGCPGGKAHRVLEAESGDVEMLYAQVREALADHVRA